MPSSNHISLLSSPGQGSPSSSRPRRLTLLVLLADTPVEAVKRKHGDYHDVFASLFQRALGHLHPQEPLEIEVRSYDVVNEPWEYPKEDELARASGLLITGSGASTRSDNYYIRAHRIHQHLQPLLHTKRYHGSTDSSTSQPGLPHPIPHSSLLASAMAIRSLREHMAQPLRRTQRAGSSGSGR